MPFRKNEPYTVHIHPFHPPIYEQGGHFFWEDGCEIPKERIKELLNYNPEICKRFGIPLNRHKHAWYESYKYPTIIRGDKQ